MTGDERPLLRIVRGNPNDEELAALTAVIAAATTPPPTPPDSRSEWANHAPLLRHPLHPAPNAWRTSTRPH